MKINPRKPEQTNHELMLATDICREMRISRRTLDDWLASGEILPGTKIGQRLYWRRIDFTKWLNGRFEGAGK
ncbi:MAG: helix-turn-helix domain-containing protein [Chitinivorax sp.]